MGRDRNRLSEDALGRIQKNLAMVLGFALLALGVISQASAIGSQDLSAVFPEIAGGAYTLVASIILLMALKGVFVAAELSVSLLRPVHIRQMKEKGDTRGAQLERLLDDQSNASSACKLGKELSQLGIFIFMLLLALSVTTIVEKWTGWPLWLNIVLSLIALYIFPIGPLTEIFEQGFRGFALAHPHGAALRLSKFITITSILLGLPARAANSFSRLLTTRFRPKGLQMANQAEEEIRTIVESAQESGEIERDERELLHSVFEFSDTMAREVMTPRVDLDAMPINSEPGDVMRVIKESGHSRIPIYEGTDDQIVGIVHAKDLLLAMVANGKDPDLRELMRPAIHVPENKPLNELLSEMKASRSQMAIVNDEYGGTAGVVTIEDIVEELVGDIVDEYDVEEPELEASGTGWSVDGKMDIDDLNHVVGSNFDSEEFDTVGGFVFGHFGRQPREGESIEVGGYRFTVTCTDGRRIERMLLEPI